MKAVASKIIVIFSLFLNALGISAASAKNVPHSSAPPGVQLAQNTGLVQNKQLTQIHTLPTFYRPTANLVFYESGDARRGLTQFYLDPDGKAFGVDFSVSVPKKSKVKEFIWQVSSLAFSAESTSLAPASSVLKPRGLLLSGRTGRGKFTIDFA